MRLLGASSLNIRQKKKKQQSLLVLVPNMKIIYIYMAFLHAWSLTTHRNYTLYIRQLCFFGGVFILPLRSTPNDWIGICLLCCFKNLFIVYTQFGAFNLHNIWTLEFGSINSCICDVIMLRLVMITQNTERQIV